MNYQIKEMNTNYSRKKLLKRIVSLLCVMVLLLTINGLKQTAVTLSRVPMCGMKEHTHTSKCYDENGDLKCGKVEHTHTDACYQQRPDGDTVADYLADKPVEEAGGDLGNGLTAGTGLEGTGLDGTGLAADDGADAVANETVVEETPEYKLGEKALLSKIIKETGLDIKLRTIEDVGIVDNDGSQAGLVEIKKRNNRDYRITAIRDFDFVELAIILPDEVKIVNLTDGVASKQATKAESGEAEEEQPADAPAAQEATKEQTEVGETTIEESVAEETATEEVADEEPVTEETASEETTDEAPVVEEPAVEEPVVEEAATGEITDEEPVTEETASKETTDEAPATEEPANEEATAEEPANEEATDEEPVAEEPATEEATDEEPATEEPVTEESTEEQTEVEETEEEPKAEETVAEEPVTEEATVEEPVTEEATAEDTEAEEAETQEPAVEEPVTEEVTGDEPVVEEPATEEPTVEEIEAEPTVEESEAEKTDTEEPAADEPVTEEATVEEPAAEEPVTEEVTVEETEAEEPVTEEATVEESAAEEPVTEEATDEEPAAEEPVTEEATDEEPVAEEPVIEEATDEEPAAEEPVTEEPAAEPVAPLLYPAMTFTGSVHNLTVDVTAPEGAFPEGTTMTVKAVYDDDTLSDIRDTVNDDFTEVKSVRAVDITFWFNDTEIEPLVPISVVMSVPEIKDEQSSVIVHVDDEGAASVVDTASASEVAVEMPATADPEGMQSAIEGSADAAPSTDEEGAEAQSAVTFESDTFSIYAYVVTETIETHYIDASGASWKITVGYGQDALIPNGASLRVSEVTGDAADELLAQTEEKLEDQKITLARFFDITILDAEGREVQPEKAVEVRVELEEKSEDQVKAVHFDEDGLEVLNATSTDDAVQFSAESFSVYGVVYTVDFEYTDPETGETKKWSLPGQGTYKISDIMAEIGVNGTVETVDLVLVEAVGETDETALYLDTVEGDWVLKSDVAFDDTYKLTVTVDGTVYEITVTDNVSFVANLQIDPTITLPDKFYIVFEQQIPYSGWGGALATGYCFEEITSSTTSVTASTLELKDTGGATSSYDPEKQISIYFGTGPSWHDYALDITTIGATSDGTVLYTDSINGNTISINANSNPATITIGNVGPVEHTARINFYDEGLNTVNETANLVSGYTLEATVGEDTYVASITGSGDLSFTKDGGATNSSILPDRVSAWTFKHNANAQSAPIALGDYVISNANPSASNHIYTFEARKPNTYTASLTFKGDSGVAETPSSLDDNYYLVVNDAFYAPVTTSGLGTWVGVTDDKLPEITSFKFVQATGPVSSVSDLTGLTSLDRIGDYDIVTSEVPTPDSSHSYAFEAAKPIICTASIAVDGTSDLSDGDYYIVATKDSADVGYYKVGATADNIGFTAFAGGTVALDTDTTFRVVKLATGAAASAEAFAAATDVASYSGAKIGENRYTWALDEGTHNYAFSVVPDTLPAGTLRQVIVNLYCHDGTTRVDDSALTPDAKEGLKDTGKKMVIVARLEDKSAAKDDPARIIGFQAVEKTFEGHGHYDGIYFNNTFTGLAYPQNANAYNYASDVTYDSEKHDISIRMYVVDSGFNIGTTVDSSVYNNLRSQAEAPEGYAFKSEPNGNVTSGATTTLNLQKALSTKYQVKVQFEEATAMPESEKIFLYVEAQHATSGIDKFGGPVVSTTPVTELTYVLYDPNNDPPSGWTQNNGGKFTGNEDVWYTLYFLKQGTTLQVDQVHVDTASYFEIEEGGYVYGNTVSYTKQRTIEEINNQNVITDYIVLTRVPTDSEYNFRTILGNGLYFGITANQLTQANDLQTNFACNTFIHEGHSVTPNLSGSSSGTFYIGEVTNSSVQINSAGNDTTCTIYVGEESKNQITAGSHVIVVPTTKANIGNIVNPILTHAKAVSDDMASHAPTMNIVVPDGANEFELNTKAFPEDATIYIDGDDAGLQRILAITDGLRITKYEDQVIVFNFKTTKSVISHQYKINGVSSATQTSQGADGTANTGSDRLARGVVWNMNTEGGNFNAGTTLGIILAPNNGTVDIAKGDSGSSGAGWIIANTVKNWSGEWHNIYADMPAVNKAIINAKKTVNNRNAKGREKFLFKLERYNTGKQWQEVKAGIQNHGSAIEFANVDVNSADHDCWTIYKITETAVVPTIDRAEAYTTTDKVYYAAVYSDYVPAEPGQGTSGNVIYPTQYYESFDEAAYAATIGASGYVPNKDLAPGVSSPITQTVPVFNNLYNTNDEDGLVATKMMEGRSLTSGDVFTFTLTGTATTKTGKTITVNQTKTNDATGKVRFDELKFALNATSEQRESGYYELEVGDFDENYEFTMQLTLAEDTTNLHPSVLPMTEPKILTVTVTRDNLSNENENEILDVTISPKNSELVFTNQYDAEGTAEITAKKAENSALGDRKFQFQLLQEDGTTVLETSTEVKQGETATFPTLNYQLSDLGGASYKDFTYKVKEVIPTDAENVEGKKVKDGVTYDTTVHTVVVRMTDDGQGNLTPSYKVDGETEFSATLSTPTFNNIYKAKGTATVTSTKQLEYKDLVGDDFKFTLAAVDGAPLKDENGDDIVSGLTVGNALDGAITFPTLYYTEADAGKTYVYSITEEEWDDTHITRTSPASGVIYAQVDVGADLGNGQLGAASVSYYSDEDCKHPLTNEFINTFNVSTTAKIEGEKEFKGTLTNGKFSFKLEADEGTPMPANATTADSKTSVTAVNSGNVFSFGNITYDLSDLADVEADANGDKTKTFTYTVSEVIPPQADANHISEGIQYDPAEHEVTVTVVFDRSESTLTATVNPERTGVKFTNTELTQISAKKTWNGSDNWLDGMSVTFTLSADNWTVPATTDGTYGANTPGVTINSQQTVNWTNLPKYAIVNGTVTEITYSVSETAVSHNGTSISNYRDVVFTITGEGSGASVVIDNQIKTTDRHAQKVWDDNDNEANLRPSSIDFTLKATANGASVTLEDYGVTAKQTAKSDNSWQVNWTDLPVYTLDGKTITYDVEESAVTNYTQTGKEWDESTRTWQFTNKVGIVSVPLEATKSMKGGETPENNYSFTLTAANGTPMPADSTQGMTNTTKTVTNNGAEISFGDITYRLSDMTDATQVAGNANKVEKTFTYTVSEVNESGRHANIVYDPAVYTVTIKLIYDASNGSLSVEDNYPAYSKVVDETTYSSLSGITFSNEETVNIPVTKAWTENGTAASWPTNVNKVTVGLFKVTDSTTTPVMDGQVQKTVVLSSGTPNDTFSGLPKYENGNVISYTVQELSVVMVEGENNNTETVTYTTTTYPSVTDMFRITYTPSDDGWTVTNKLYETTINVLKRSSASGNPPLSGATFTLVKMKKQTSESGVITYVPSNTWPSRTANSGSDGTLTFSNLPAGFYRIEETHVPAGFARTGDQYIYFKIAGGQVTWMTDDTYKQEKTTGNQVTYDSTNKTFTVYNMPGVALPATGGPGTTVYYAAGIALMLAAIVLLLRRKARNEAE